MSSTTQTEEVNSNIANSGSALSISLSQETLHQVLSLVSRAVAKHGIQPVLSNVFLQANKEDKTLTLGATDLDLSLAITIPAEVKEAGEVTIPAQKLQELIGKLPHIDLTLTSSDKAQISLACGRSKFEIKGLSSEQFPKDFLHTKQKAEQQIKLPIKHLQNAAHLVSFASDKREVNSILNGICLEMNEKGLEIAATDGSRLAYYIVPECKSEETKKVIIPFRAVAELSRMLSGVNEEEIECYILNSSQIVFKSATRTLSSSLVDGSYPKYQQLIPSNHTQKAIVDRLALLSTLDRVSVLANERTKVVKLLFEEIGVLNVSANTPDLGEAEDQLDLLEYTGQDFSIAFNVNYMSECLRNLDCQYVELKMSEPLKPIIVSPVKGNPAAEGEEEKKDKEELNFEYLYLLMPVQMRVAG